MKEKIWIFDMTWSNTPFWLYAVGLFPILSFAMMWVAKAYVWKVAMFLSFLGFGLGTIAFLILGMFFSYQYPRK